LSWLPWVQIAGGYYGNANTQPDTAVATTEVNKGKGWPVRLLTAYIVRPGEYLRIARMPLPTLPSLFTVCTQVHALDSIISPMYAHYQKHGCCSMEVV